MYEALHHPTIGFLKLLIASEDNCDVDDIL